MRRVKRADEDMRRVRRVDEEGEEGEEGEVSEEGWVRGRRGHAQGAGCSARRRTGRALRSWSVATGRTHACDGLIKSLRSVSTTAPENLLAIASSSVEGG